MKRLYIYRNCFTGDISGGDMHMSGFICWSLEHRPDCQINLILPENDGQERAYPDVAKVSTSHYPDTKIRGPLALMYVARSLKALLRVRLPRSDRDTVIIASSHFLPDVLPAFFAGGRRSQRGVYIHHIIQDMPRPNNLNTRLANLQEKVCFALIRRRFQKIVVANKDVVSRLRALGFHKQQILLSSNFVNLQASARPLPYAKKDISIAFCGRMVTQKGVDDFIDICRQLAADDKQFRAVMIGAGPELERLRALVKREQLPVELPGFVEDDLKFQQIARAKLFVIPSVEEGWGIAIAEALFVGTPVITYALPIYPAIFGDHIRTTPLGNRQALHEAVRQALALYAKQPAAYKTEQERATTFAERFDVDHVARQEFAFLTGDAHA